MPKLDGRSALHLCASDLGHSPTRAEYGRWRRRLPEPKRVLSGQRIAHRKTWVEALALADLEPRQHNLSDAEIWAVIRQVRAELGSPSASQYDRWRRRVSPKPPSPQTLTNRTGRCWGDLFV